MILLFILGISFIQFTLYYLNTRFKTKLPNFILLLVFLICYIFIFPQFFYPEPRANGINCGLPVFAVTFTFWVFGTIAGLTTHIIWELISLK